MEKFLNPTRVPVHMGMCARFRVGFLCLSFAEFAGSQLLGKERIITMQKCFMFFSCG